MKRETAIILLSCFKRFNIDLKAMERVLRRSDALLECLITSGVFEMSMNIIKMCKNHFRLKEMAVSPICL